MILDLSDEQARALLNLLTDMNEADRSHSPRIRLLQEILGKCGEVGGLTPNSLNGSAAIARHRLPDCRRQKSVILLGGHGRDGEPGKPTAQAAEKVPPGRLFVGPGAVFSEISGLVIARSETAFWPASQRFFWENGRCSGTIKSVLN
jgi:hypothetical protein